MIGTVNSNQDSRQLLLTEFLKHSGICDLKLFPLADDCSFRRYYRVQTKTNNLVVMDAPPDKEEVNPFIQMSDLLNKLGFSAPPASCQCLELYIYTHYGVMLTIQIYYLKS